MRIISVSLLCLVALQSHPIDAIDIPRFFGQRPQTQQQQAAAAAALLEGVTEGIQPAYTVVDGQPQLQQQVQPQAQYRRRGFTAGFRPNRGGDNNMAIAGTFAGILEKIKKDASWEKIKAALNKGFYVSDVIVLGVLGWLTEPIVHGLFRLRYGQEPNNYDVKPYEETWWHKGARVIQELGRLGIFVYTLDMVSIIIRKSGFHIPPQVNERLAQVCLTIWGTTQVRKLKQAWLRQVLKKNPEQGLGKALVMDKVMDGGLVIVLLFFIQDIFQITMGKGLQSIAAFGGVSGIIFSLAAKDFAQMLLSGVAIHNSDKFVEGEYIKFGDGTEGTVVKLGAFEFHLRGGDGVITKIPNGQITNQRVQNLSRTSKTTITQTLWFKYEDISKLPQVLEDIKREIAETCPNLINDGSKPFRAVWTDYQHDHLEAVVKATFDVNPTTEESYETKQTMLQAIAKAVTKNNVEFAYPTSICKTE